LQRESTAKVKFIRNLPTEDIYELFNSETTPGILVLDDLMQEVNKDKNVLRWITADGHHSDFAIIIMQQSVFPNFKNTVQVRNNCTTKFLWNFPTDKRSVETFLGKIERGKSFEWLVQWYKECTEKDCGYIVISKHPRDKSNMLMYRTNILKEKGRPATVYIKKKVLKKYKSNNPTNQRLTKKACPSSRNV